MSLAAPAEAPWADQAPNDAPSFIPTPVGEDFIHAFAGGALDPVTLWVLLLTASRGEGKTSTGIVGQMALADALGRAGLGHRLPYITAVVRDTWVNLRRSTIQTFLDFQQLGVPLRVFDDDHQAVVEQDGLVTNHFWFFGLDRPADADRLQGFTCGCLWIEEAAPAADFSGGVAPEALGIGSTSVRQPGVPRRILLTQNPADDEHWTATLEETLRQHGALEGLEVRKFWMPPGGKAKHFLALAHEAEAQGDPEEALRWRRAAVAFEAYRQTSGALLEATGRGDLVQRLIRGEPGSVKLGEPVVPEFSRALHVATHPLRPLPGLTVFRWWDLGGVHPACVFSQALAANAGLNVLGSCVGENVATADFLLNQVLPLQEALGVRPRRDGDPFRKGRSGVHPMRDISDPTNNAVDARKIIEAMLRTRVEPGPERWVARRQALQTAFLRKGQGDRMWVQLDPDHNKLLIQSLGGRWHYPINSVTGRINGTLEASKLASGIFSHAPDALGYGLAKLWPAHEWLRRVLATPAPRVEARAPRSWLGV